MHPRSWTFYIVLVMEHSRMLLLHQENTQALAREYTWIFIQYKYETRMVSVRKKQATERISSYFVQVFNEIILLRN